MPHIPPKADPSDEATYDRAYLAAMSTGHITPENADAWARVAVQLRRKALEEDFAHPEFEAKETRPTEPPPAHPVQIMPMMDHEFARELGRRLNILTEDHRVAEAVAKFLLRDGVLLGTDQAEALHVGMLRPMGLFNALIGTRVTEGPKKDWGLLTVAIEDRPEVTGRPILHFTITDDLTE